VDIYHNQHTSIRCKNFCRVSSSHGLLGVIRVLGVDVSKSWSDITWSRSRGNTHSKIGADSSISTTKSGCFIPT